MQSKNFVDKAQGIRGCKKRRHLSVCTLLFCMFLLSTPQVVFSAVPASSTPPNALALAAQELLGVENATAEDILILAHNRDTRAMALAATGYAKGIGGFPREPILAGAWFEQGVKHTALESAFTSNLLLYQELDEQGMHFGSMLAQCATARNSIFASVLKKNAIFDVDTFCTTLESKKSSYPDWENISQLAIKDQEKELREVNVAIRMIREKALKPMMKEEERVFLDALEMVMSDEVVFFAATTHDPANEAPDWSVERILAFLDTCHASRTEANVTQNLMMEFGWSISMTLQGWLAGQREENQQEIRNLITQAHDSSPKVGNDTSTKIHAMRAMARNYREGSLGFLCSLRMAMAWDVQVGLHGDTESMLRTALAYSQMEQTAVARMWAELALEHGTMDDATRRVFKHILNRSKALLPKGLSEEFKAQKAIYDKEIRKRMQK